MKRGTFLAVTVGLASIAPHDAFVPRVVSSIQPTCSSSVSSSSLQVAKGKQSMKEKRKQRQAKQIGLQFQNPYANLPKSQLDFQETAASKALDTPEKLSNPTEAAEKARELLKVQRASVDMLSKVKARIEALPSEEIMSALNSRGYYIVDSLLADGDVLAQLETEALRLYEGGELEIDMSNLGSGEYTTAIKGGSEQYVKCPRLVEWTVSTTKHLPERMTELSLDSSACMATLRTFDRKAFQASLNLLTGSETVTETKNPFATVVSDPVGDKRRISLQYFLVPESWDPSCGGSISFESGEEVSAQRDRLVLWKSDSVPIRKEMWKGNDAIPFASSIELHLLGKTSE